jgi:uncharacterized RDD family membrane protein YckC
MDLLRSQALWVRIFNVALLVPLGVFLRRWWRRGFWTTTLVGLGLSLAFELTQLTGIWGLYPCPYRTFDVDDLMANTLGAALGWIIAPLIVILPSRHESDDATRIDDRPTVPRRVVADAIDFVLAILLAIPLARAVALLPGIPGTLWGQTSGSGIVADVLALGIVVAVAPALAGGRSPGKALVRLKVTRNAGDRAGWWRLVVRAAALWLPLIGPIWALDAIDTDVVGEATGAVLLLALISVPVLWIITVIGTVIARADDRGPHDLAAGTSVRVSVPRHLDARP